MPYKLPSLPWGTKADEAFLLPLPEGQAIAPYLAIDQLIDVAKRCGADAIHPGEQLESSPLACSPLPLTPSLSIFMI